jgi:hypothetical protein
MSEGERKIAFSAALDVVDSYFPKYDEADRLIEAWPQCGEAIPHVDRLAALMEPESSCDNSVCLKMGELLERAAWHVY